MPISSSVGHVLLDLCLAQSVYLICPMNEWIEYVLGIREKTEKQFRLLVVASQKPQDQQRNS